MFHQLRTKRLLKH